jgi:ribosomal protein S5
VRVEIGDPVATVGLGRGDQRELAEAVRRRIRDLLDRGGE